MSDIVARLRASFPGDPPLIRDAIAEIEQHRAEVIRLMAARDGVDEAIRVLAAWRARENRQE